jgi:hypothetical protein
MIQAQSADGVIHQFPDGTAQAVVDGAMKAYVQSAKSTAAPAKPRAAQPSLAQNVTGFMANVNRGLGIGDELAAGAKTVGNLFSGKLNLQPRIGGGGAFDQAVVNDFKGNLAQQRQLEAGYQAAHPHMAALAQGTGMAATAAVPAGDTANLFGARSTRA